MNNGNGGKYENLVKTAGLEAVNKRDVKLLGAWKPTDEADERLFLLFNHASKEAAAKTWDAVKSDPAWSAALQEYRELNGNPVAHFQRVFLEELDFGSNLQLGTQGDHVFEMRTYVTTHGNLPRLHNRFRNHTVALFEKHGMKNLIYWSVDEADSSGVNELARTLAPIGVEPLDFDVSGPVHENLLVYLLAHDSQDSAKASFGSFRVDPDWRVALDASEKDAGGSLTVQKGVLSLFLKPCDFSPLK